MICRACNERYFNRIFKITIIDLDFPVTGILLPRKEVIQPQVPLRLPCYDFIPITTHTFGAFLPCGLVRRLRVQTAFVM